MEQRMLTFRPDDFEWDFINEQNIKWSDFCHEALKQDMEGTKRKSLENLSNKFLLIFFGVVCYVISYTVIDWIVYVVLNVGAIVLICSGFFLLYKEIRFLYMLRNERGDKK